MLEQIELILFEDDVDDFIYDHAKDILVYEKPIEDLLEEADMSRLTSLNIEPYISKLREIFKHIKTIFNNADNDYILPNNFNDFIKDNKVNIDDYKDWYEIVYEIILDIIPKKETSTNIFGLDFDYMIARPPNLSSSAMTSSIINRDRINEKNNLKDEIQILSGLKDEQMKILRDYGKISGLWSGLLVLIYACIVGIVIPSLLLPYPLGVYDDLATRKLLLKLFFSQLIVLFIYLFISMYRLTRVDYKV